MREYRNNRGERCLWYDDDEIERIVDVELRKAGLMPKGDACVVDIERFIEGHQRAALDHYAALPPEVLGVTEFVRGRAPRISINRDLTGVLDDDEPLLGSVGRLRATLAHESAHVLLHRVFYEAVPENLPLFPDSEKEPAAAPVLHRCPKTAVGDRRPRTDWREVQANMGMAALLMPRRVFASFAREAIMAATRQETISQEEIPLVVSEIAVAFQVSKQAAAIRLQTLKLVRIAGQQSL